MTIGLPGTGIGGIFYLLLAVWMPIRESARTLKGKTNLRRWCFITLQLLFVLGVTAAMWSEMWILNQILAWTCETIKINGQLLVAKQAFHQTKVMALTSASASFVSLAFVITSVHILRFFVHRAHRKQHSPAPKSHTAFQMLNPAPFAPNVS